VWVRVKRTTNSKAVGAVKGLTSNELSGVEGWPPIFTRIVSPTSTSVAVLEGVILQVSQVLRVVFLVFLSILYFPYVSHL